MPRRYVMAISCICHYRPAHKLVTAHLECRAPPRVCPLFVLPLSFSLPLSTHPRLPLSLFPLLMSVCQFGSPSLLFICLAPFRLLFALGRSLLVFLFSAPSACHRVVCIAVAKRRSLSSLINVDPLLIYRRVALKVNDALCERTTLGIPVAR